MKGYKLIIHQKIKYQETVEFYYTNILDAANMLSDLENRVPKDSFTWFEITSETEEENNDV